MKIRVCFICLLILLAFSGHTGLAQTPRDLTRYDNGGVFDFNWGAGAGAHARMMPKLRDFLWTHWTQKHLAHVVVSFYSIEGDPTTYNLYIEPDKDQRWRVVAEYESDCCWFYAMEKPKRKLKRMKGIVVYESIGRVQTSGNGQETLSFVPRGDRRDPDTYILQLRQIVEGNKLHGWLIF